MKGNLVFNFINQEKRIIERHKFNCNIEDEYFPLQCQDCNFFGQKLNILKSSIEQGKFIIEIEVPDKQLFDDIKEIYSVKEAK